MIIHYDIIPISFFPGSGGNMLLNILRQSKLKTNQVLELSSNGNAHKTEYEVLPVFFNIQNSQIYAPGKDYNRDLTDELISSIKQLQIIRPTCAPYFALYHGKNQEQLSKYFYKKIIISYDEDDFKPIISLLHKKLHFDDWSDNEQITDGPHLDKKISVKEWQEKRIKDIRNQKSGYDFYEERCLNIKFKELNELPTIILFEKLSEFTQIPLQNFSDSNLLRWREINQRVISEYKWFI